ncbi:MAG: TonB-dependent receptor [Gemmatimonadaceae bacterium]|nr:TonB-dependent receptor [Gemmatimonadaceae bacterium]
MRCWIVLLGLTLLAAGDAAAQATGRITGTVTVDSGKPLPNVTVAVSGSTVSAITDANGRYNLVNAPVGTQTIVARLLGYTRDSAVVTVAAGQTVTRNFSLTTAPTNLTGMVVVGYGTQERRNVTSALTTVTAEKMKDIPTSDPMKALQGRIPGVEIVTNSNEPGANMQVRIRGVRSMSSERNEPLYVVDGIPINGGIGDFNPAIIDNITVLKDASATAIYGSRGANGVVLVTTKKGSTDGRLRTSYSVDSYYGSQTPLQIIPMMNMQQFVKYLQDAAAINGQDTSLARVLAGQTFVPGTTTSKRLYAYQNGIETDWQRAVLRDGLQRNFQANVSGSAAGTRFSLSGNYFNQEGVIPGQASTRGNAFATVDHVSKYMQLGASISLSRSLQEIGEGQGAFGYATAMTPFGRPTNYTTPDSAGLLDPRPDDDPLNINPLLEAQSMIRDQTTTRAFASLYGTLQLRPWLSYRVNFGPDYTNSSLGCYNDPWTHGPCSNPGANSANQGQPPQAMLRNQTDFAYTLDNLLQFNKVIGDHNFDATALYSIQKDRFTKDSMYATQLPYNTQLWYDLGSGTAGNNLSLISEWALQSYMGRVNYTFKDRYTLSATGRSDGSSRLAPGNQWAFFPSFSAAWQIGDESFVRNLGWFDQLKLRASYGTTGNTSISPYQTQGTLTSKLYTFGTTRVRGYRPGTIANPGLTWEKTDATNYAVDFAVLRSRLSGSVDVYSQNTRDLLLSRLLPVTSGFTSTLQNIGSTKNSGVEVLLSTINLQNWHGLTWTSDINWSTNKNKITALQTGSAQDVNNVWFVGQPINLTGDPQRRVFYDWKWDGIWQYGDSVAMRAFNANGATFRPGDPRVKDINGDGRINADDRMIVGTSYPKWIASLYNRFEYKGFDISGLLTWKHGYTFIDGTPRSYTGRLGVMADMDYWTPTNPSTRNPAPNLGQVERLYATTRLYTDGSHWRIRNITLGYTMPASLTSRIGAQSIRFYGTAQDPYVHTNYLGADPEVAGAAPALRTLLIGSNITW